MALRGRSGLGFLLRSRIRDSSPPFDVTIYEEPVCMDEMDMYGRCCFICTS